LVCFPEVPAEVDRKLRLRFCNVRQLHMARAERVASLSSVAAAVALAASVPAPVRRDVAQEQGTSLVDLFTAFEDCGKLPGHSINDLRLAGDGIHHNNGGQRLVCELLTRRIAAGMCRQ
jgi:hypothetical protein